MLTGAGATDTLKSSVMSNIPSPGAGGTSINEGLCGAHNEFLMSGRVGYTKKIILLTDGITLLDSGTQELCAPLFDSSSHSDTAIDLNSLEYETLVIGIEPANGSWVTAWNTLHTSEANGGEAYIAEFAVLDTIINSLLVGACS